MGARCSARCLISSRILGLVSLLDINVMFHEQTFSCGDFTLNGAMGPRSGPPLVFLHGITRRWQDFLTLMPSLTPRWTVYGLDFRGHGRSDRSTSYLVADHVRDIAA